MFTFLFLDLPLRVSATVQPSFPLRLRGRATMVVPWDPTSTRPLNRAAKPATLRGQRPTLDLTHERVDDVPLLVSFLIRLRIPETVDRIVPPHPLHQGLSNGWLVTVWIAYILSQGDHRKAPVQQWVDRLQHTLESLIGQTIRSVDFSDDRLALVLKRLSHEPAWHELEAALFRVPCEVYALPPVERIRLDATTTYGYHAIDADRLMQLGHSKDQRPDLPQIKPKAAAAEPTGMFLAGDHHAGNPADDPLYLPLY